MRKFIYEIFSEVEKANTDEERVAVLQKNRCYELECVLRGAFSPSVQYLIEKVPYYKPADIPVGMAHNTIASELNRVYLFEKYNPRRPKTLTKERMNVLLIQMLEGMEAKEATAFINMLMKNLKVKGLDEKIVRTAFPDLLGPALG